MLAAGLLQSVESSGVDPGSGVRELLRCVGIQSEQAVAWRASKSENADVISYPEEVQWET